MTFDTSRSTFDPWNDYSAVVMEQGRVQLDSDWNEWLAEISRRTRAGTLDLVGRAAYPPTTPFAFQVTASVTGTTNSLSIGRGRMYVDGLLAENHGTRASAAWDPALAELSGSPQPPPATDTDPVDFTAQPYAPGATVPTGNGAYLAYLDVWTRPVTWLEDTDLVDKAVAVDTTGRLQTVWQVRLLPVPGGSTWSCATPDSDIPYPSASAGQLTTAVIPNPSAGPCCLTDDTGYTGLENQNYRVEIHQGGSGSDTANLSGATFKWSRDNGSVSTGVTSIASATNTLNEPASQLTVLSLGRDQVLGLSPGDWIEILDDAHQLNGQPGELHQIDSIDVSSRTITLTATLSASFPVGQPALNSHTRIVRWDQSGKVYEQDGTTVWWDLGAAGSNGTIPMPGQDTTLILESGVTVTFSLSTPTGAFNAADFWTFAARAADGSVQELAAAPPQGIQHHYTKLSIVTFTSPPSYPDCRTPFPSGGADCDCCCTCTVGDGVVSTGKFSSIQAAINSLPSTGGEVCIGAGRYFENVVIRNAADVVVHGCGRQTRIASASLGGDAGVEVTSAGASGMNAVISVVGSSHIELRSLAVEAADAEVGVLLDRAGAQEVQAQVQARTAGFKSAVVLLDPGDTDITLDDLVIAASTRPAILALEVTLLRITGNRVATKDVRSLWPAVSVRGNEIHIEHNWVGLQDAALARAWLPASVISDLPPGLEPELTAADVEATDVTELPLAPAGIQIAGPSQDVFVIENEIEGGRRNGITLGSLVLLDADGSESSTLVGILPVEEDECSTSGTLQLPPTSSTGQSLGAGGLLSNIQIDRNRIRNMGLCGIGPVGFFDLEQTLEVISIENLAITGNEISSTLLSPLTPSGNTTFGYGAICVADVDDLVVRDNIVTDFGATLSAEVSGIFVLHAEMAEISRNQVLQPGAWTSGTETQAAAGLRAGIMLLAVTPPALPAVESDTSALIAPLYQPGVPAVRVEHNVVQVAVGEALEIVGLGPFSVVNNSLSSGGTVLLAGTSPAVTVMILNLGAAVGVNETALFSGLQNAPTSNLAGRSRLTAPSSGAVIFTNNICQLETRAGYQPGFASVLVGSLDHVLFGDNSCWEDGLRANTEVDVLVLARTVQVTSNRFQENFQANIGEIQTSVFGSCLSIGLANITAQNISDNTIYAIAPATTLVDSSNLVAP
ncbi:MAG: DUF6519 domain-containing protein [Streptosporangiaceae bacterium]